MSIHPLSSFCFLRAASRCAVVLNGMAPVFGLVAHQCTQRRHRRARLRAAHEAHRHAGALAAGWCFASSQAPKRPQHGELRRPPPRKRRAWLLRRLRRRPALLLWHARGRRRGPSGIWAVEHSPLSQSPCRLRSRRPRLRCRRAVAEPRPESPFRLQARRYSPRGCHCWTRGCGWRCC